MYIGQTGMSSDGGQSTSSSGRKYDFQTQQQFGLVTMEVKYYTFKDQNEGEEKFPTVNDYVLRQSAHVHVTIELRKMTIIQLKGRKPNLAAHFHIQVYEKEAKLS